MHDTFRNQKALAGCELHFATLEINEQVTLHDIEEFIFIVVLVPVELTLDNAQSNNRIVYLAQGLIVPLFLARVDERRNVNQLERAKLDVGIDVVGGVARHVLAPVHVCRKLTQGAES